jgi:hypothetical protein
MDHAILHGKPFGIPLILVCIYVIYVSNEDKNVCYNDSLRFSPNVCVREMFLRIQDPRSHFVPGLVYI